MHKLKQKNLICFLIVILSLAFIFQGCSKKAAASDEPISKTELLMDTVCSVKIYDSSDTKILDKAFDRIRQIEAEMSINKDGTEVDKVNKSSGISSVKVSDDVFQVVKRGIYYGEKSSGIFDIAIGPIVRLWNIGSDNPRVPSEDEIKSKLPLVNYKDIVIDENSKSIMLKKKDMVIDLGGIAKGFTADAVAEVLKANGVNHAIINLGGNVLTLSDNPSTNKPWKIGVQNPLLERGDYIGIVNVTNKTVVSSGIYERYFEKDGKRYHHMLNPFNGYPFDNNLASVTIVTDKSIDGDGLSTTVFGMGLDKGMKFVQSLEGVDAIFITKNSEVYISEGLKSNFQITDSSFTLKN